VSHRCTTCNGCGKRRRIALADEKDENRSPG
jgi:hypothetical protein